MTSKLDDQLQYLMQPGMSQILIIHQTSSTNLDIENYDETNYDVFLSFAEEDKSVALSQIKIPLEEKGYSICWHHDAFMPGYTIIENIEKAIHESRITIVMLSRYFADSEFCLKELQIAVNKSEQLPNKDCIIPVKLDESLSIISELKKLTYVDINDKNLIEKICKLLGMK